MLAATIALHVWGQPHGCTTVQHHLASLEPNILGTIERPCTILLTRRRMTAATYCTVVLHEWGHLTGHRHSDNPRSVMYPALLRPDPRCRSL